MEAVDRSLQDIIQTEELFGGTVVCLAGDPRQTLPIVKRGGRASIVNSCIQMSPIYPYFKQLYLTENMRTDPEEIEFSDFLIKIGEGKEEVLEDLGDFAIKIPDEYLVAAKEDLIERVFPKLGAKDMVSDEMVEGAIYTPLNVSAKEINDFCLDKFLGDSRTYLSADSILEDNYQNAVPPEHLNSIAISGMPDHQLYLKIGCPVILLRNLQGNLNNLISHLNT